MGEEIEAELAALVQLDVNVKVAHHLRSGRCILAVAHVAVDDDPVVEEGR